MSFTKTSFIGLLTSLLASTALAADDQPGKVIAGWVERVTVLDIREQPIKAKLDSGANTSSIHAVDVDEFERENEDWVRFKFVDKDGDTHTLEKPIVRGVKIKDLDGGSDRRPVIELDMCFDGRLHTTQFTLSDRGDFNYRILLGRRFLKGVAVIDPQSTYMTKEHCRDAEPDKD